MTLCGLLLWSIWSIYLTTWMTSTCLCKGAKVILFSSQQSGCLHTKKITSGMLASVEKTVTCSPALQILSLKQACHMISPLCLSTCQRWANNFRHTSKRIMALLREFGIHFFVCIVNDLSFDMQLTELKSESRLKELYLLLYLIVLRSSVTGIPSALWRRFENGPPFRVYVFACGRILKTYCTWNKVP